MKIAAVICNVVLFVFTCFLLVSEGPPRQAIEEIPFGGHPTLGTAMVLRNLRLADGKRAKTAGENRNEIVLDLQVGKVPVEFREDGSGNVFGEMHQVEPVFGPLHDRETVAGLLDLKPSDISVSSPSSDSLILPSARTAGVACPAKALRSGFA